MSLRRSSTVRIAFALALTLALAGCGEQAASGGDRGRVIDEDAARTGSAGSGRGGGVVEADGDALREPQLTDEAGLLDDRSATELRTYLAEIEDELDQDIHVVTIERRENNAVNACAAEQLDSSFIGCANALLGRSDAEVLILVYEGGEADVAIVSRPELGDRLPEALLDEIIGRMADGYVAGGWASALTTAVQGIAEALRGDAPAGAPAK